MPAVVKYGCSALDRLGFLLLERWGKLWSGDDSATIAMVERVI